MNLATTIAERVPLPDPFLRRAIANRVAHTARTLSPMSDAAFAASMQGLPVARHTDAANAQHYELPPDFFGHVLGTHRKYSSCLYQTGQETLDQAELAALQASASLAQLADGQTILELGCGWGSFSLYMAAQFPNARITAVSNSASQRAYIDSQAAARGLTNLRILTADMNDFAPSDRFDRVVSIEMFEHMSNWRELLARIRAWLAPEGRLFLHVFSHAETPYRFDLEHGADWIAKYFFTGGLMPSHRLIFQFAELFAVESEQLWPGHHYERTALHWLENFDRNRPLINPLLRQTYGAEAAVWARRWRLFFLAVAGLFGHAGGAVWQVSQYRLRPQ